ncbi:MAG: DinB family protein [Rectinemataceae bacterium]
MKEILEALAKYKMKVDESVLGIIEKLGEDKLLAPTGAYFPTIYDQLKHVFGSGVNWIKRLKAAFPKSAALSASRFSDFDLQTLKAPFGEAGARLFADIRELDRSVCAFVAELDEKALAAAFTYKNYKGETETHKLWEALLHWFNHDTHHRGAISCQMDSLGIENDFSSLLTKI